MATEYVRVYKFARQNNYAGPRKVAWTKFAVSGDTNRTIGQITGIRYSHYHTSNDNPTRSLRGRITLADGTVFVSNADSHKFQDNVVQFVNTFASLPTAEQFSQIASIETINESGYNDNTGYSSRLYWRATSDYPLTVTVTFVETPPTRYVPKVVQFVVGRCDASGTMADDGAYIKTTLKLSIGDRAGLSDNMSVKIYYKADGVPTTSDSSVTLTSRINDLLTGVTMDSTILPNQWALGSAWYFAVVFAAGDEVATGADSVGNAFAPLFISKDGKRVSVGGFPKRGSGVQAFEVFAPAYLYGGIAQIGDGSGSILPQLGVQCGQTAAQSVSSGGVKDFEITFTQAFAAAPVVIASVTGSLSGSSAGGLSAVVRAVSATGCTIRVASTTTTYSVGVSWIAVGT